MGLSDFKYGGAIPVSDIDKAKDFYGGKLGLSGGPPDPSDGGITYECAGGTSFHVYPSPDNAGKSGATLGGWYVTEIETVVDELSSNGLSFEQYDEGPIKTNEKGIAEVAGEKVAFVKDPDGNILGLFEG